MNMSERKQTRWYQRLVRAFRWCFVRRLAIMPMANMAGYFHVESHPPQRMMFEWQKMPEGWRWF